ncbi:MAG: kynureninase, partial [Candidatus Heimdallarchaeota archaeon]|nr:kynureninase [Candidatus Heimdallarchaeota archaeon]
MNHDFELGESYAKKLDSEDELAKFRDYFYIPEGSIYFNGNSLGLLPKNAEKSFNRILSEWKLLAVKGWLEAEKPWFFFAERLGELSAPLVGADPKEVIATATTTVNIHSLISTFYKPEGNKTKILADELNFPTDIYALQSQIKL